MEDGAVQEKVIVHFRETAEPGLVEVQKYVEDIELGKWNNPVLVRGSRDHSLDNFGVASHQGQGAGFGSIVHGCGWNDVGPVV